MYLSLYLLFKRSLLIVIWITTDLKSPSILEWMSDIFTHKDDFNVTSSNTHCSHFWRHLAGHLPAFNLIYSDMTSSMFNHQHFTFSYYYSIYSPSRQGLLLLLLLFTKCRTWLLSTTTFFTKHYFNDILNPNKLFR